MEKIYFAETQYFSWWTWALIALLAVGFGVIFVVQITLKIKVGTRPMPSWLALVFCLALGAFSFFMAMQCLKVKITNEAVYYSLGAFARPRTIRIDEISTMSLRKYDGMAEFSGWGVRTNSKENCFTVSGDDGLEIKLKDGNKKLVLIGTQQAAQLQDILKAYFAGMDNKPAK